jgi:transcriptional regulator with XRE-family HTH domain
MNTVLKALRESKKMSQEQVAKLMHINQNTYSKLETGQTSLTIDRAKELATIFEVEPEVFLQKDGSAFHNNTGQGANSKSHFTIENYHEIQKELLDELMKEKEATIQYLRKDIENYRKEIDRLLNLLEIGNQNSNNS